MEPYKNLGGDSGISAYDIGTGSITVYFQDGSAYLYNSIKPGTSAVNEMIRLARNGSGLNSYISRIIKKNYYRKIR